MGPDSRPGIDFLFANDFSGRIRAKAGIASFRHSGTRASADPESILPVVIMDSGFAGHSASFRAFTPVFDGLWTRVNAL